MSRGAAVPDFGDALPRNLTAAEREFIRKNPAPIGRDARAVSAAPAGAIDSVAEYEAMEGLVVSWVGPSSWTSILAQIGRRVTVEGGGRLYVGVPGASTQTSATNSLNAQGANLANVTFFTVPLDGIWARDYGPRYVYEGDAGSQVRVIADHKYNRPTRPRDDNQPITFGDLKRHQYYEMGTGSTTLVHGGGNYHLASDGDAYATDLIVDENPSLTASTIRGIWRDYQGNETTITGEFPLSVDATGHIDMWMQIYADKKVFISDWPTASGSVQDTICDATAALMTSRGYAVTRLPAQLSGGTHYTFANMVIMNDVVLLPQYNAGPGATASNQTRAIVQAAFGPGKTVYGINADALVTSAGVFHCIVQHVPAHRGAIGQNGGLAPTALLTGVAGGEEYRAGDVVNLRWITDDDAPVAATGGVQAVDVELSTDGGATWKTSIATGQPALGTLAWTIPAGIETTRARVRVVARDAVGNVGADDNGFDFSIDSRAPQLASGAFAFQTDQRIDLAFDEAVTPGGVALVDRLTGEPSGVALDVAATGGTVIVRAAMGLIPDGDWRLTFAAVDAAGNAAAPGAIDFHVLAGDADRDRDVDFADLVTLAQNYGRDGLTFGDGNFDYSADGRVGFSDLVVLAQAYGTSLATPMSAAVASAAEPTKSKRRGPGIDELR